MDIATPAGPVALRPETAADESFRLALFGASRQPGWALFPPGPALEQLMLMQFRGQAKSYKAQYPDARFEIVEWAGAPAGRLAVDRAAGCITLIDIALAPEVRRRGIGTAILSALIAEALAAGLPLRLSVATGNLAAQRLYRRLGFAMAAQGDAYLQMQWPASAATRRVSAKSKCPLSERGDI